MINYDIYQLKDDPSLHSIRFANTKFMNTHNIPIDAGNYDKVCKCQPLFYIVR